ARGKLTLKTPIPIVNRFRSIVDGSPYRLPVPRHPRDIPPRVIGQDLPVKTLIEEMITISSNLATNLLLQRVGPKNAMTTLRRLGLRGIEILRGVQDLKAFDRGLSNRCTARGMTRLYVRLARGQVISKDASKAMLDVLSRQRLHAKLPPLLPRAITLAHKGGTISTVSHDGGVASRHDRPEYVIVIMSQGYRRLAHVNRVLARMSRAIYRHVAKKRGWQRKHGALHRPRLRSRLRACMALLCCLPASWGQDIVDS
ncbi:MAG: serine hydrolase, partial [Deltaproteobacteria bacterium]|nr:serine hydrolase [Deltaproteobacteria bacterium]